MQTAELSVSVASCSAFQPRLGRSVTIDRAAHLLGVSRRTIYYRIGEGRLRTIRTLGGSQRVVLESLEALRSIN